MIFSRSYRSAFAALASLAMLFPLLPASAQSPEQHYLTERDRMRTAVRKAEAKGSDASAADTKAVTVLKAKLRALIGPVDINGMQDVNEMRPNTLTTDMGGAALDSIVFRKAPKDYAAIIQVSTETLLERWLAERQTKYAGKNNEAFAVPAQMASALVSDRFYTFAFDDGAAVQVLSNLPITKRPDAKYAVAMLEGRTQGAPVALPENLIVAAVQGGLVFIAEVPLKVKFTKLEACAGKIDGDGFPTAEYTKCFAANAPKYKAYKAAARQAQELYDSFPLRATP